VDSNLLTVRFHPRAQVRAPRDLLFGIGHSPDKSLFVALNHKTTNRQPGRLESAELSVSEFVRNATRDLREGWRRSVPGGIASVRRIAVEDASLNTCMALLPLTQAIAADAEHDSHVVCAVQTHGDGNAEAKQRLDSWIRYVTDWEQHFRPSPCSSPSSGSSDLVRPPATKACAAS